MFFIFVYSLAEAITVFTVQHIGALIYIVCRPVLDEAVFCGTLISFSARTPRSVFSPLAQLFRVQQTCLECGARTRAAYRLLCRSHRQHGTCDRPFNLRAITLLSSLF